MASIDIPFESCKTCVETERAIILSFVSMLESRETTKEGVDGVFGVDDAGIEGI